VDDDSKSFVHQVVLVQAVLLTEWTKRPILSGCSTVPCALHRFDSARYVIAATLIAVRFARV
jgi:hypothetical protein